MKPYVLIVFGILFCSQTSFSQSFIEICSLDPLDGTVVNMEEFNDTLYGTGFFNQICGSPAAHLAKWNGIDWDPTNVSLSNDGHSLTAIGSDLYISSYVNSIDSNWVYQYDGNTVSKLGTGVYLTTATSFSNLSNIYDVIEFNGSIIACGEFDRVGDDTISGIMRWNGGGWESLGDGFSGNIVNAPPIMYPHQMVVHNSELYVVGNFRYAGNTEVNGVAKWDGSSWTALGDGFNSTVYGIGLYNGEVWVGGDFTMSGTQPMERISKWNGTDWESPGFGFVNQSVNDYTFVHSFMEADGGLYIAGGLKRIAMDIGTTIDCGGIIHFSSSGINTFNGGVQGNDIEAIGKTQSNQLVIGGGVFGDGYTGILDQVSGQNELSSKSSIQLIPNPAADIVEIKTDKTLWGVDVFDVRGNNVLSRIASNELHISFLTSGFYFVHVRTHFGTEVIKMVK